eukprot:CAMPEP_0119190610 /NCGR_PEP_ID=MMETSP1316-20130426/1639_1 /TAXON_ID=41880 /ORGANISM="Pycnococcus provasolii, Strain RCC2336" /LENGTH=283 /DNA_ID=CAMNT_0007185507 /DNA_START=154 /DNA_END=1007 /DNA_ORIENTATION=-
MERLSSLNSHALSVTFPLALASDRLPPQTYGAGSAASTHEEPGGRVAQFARVLVTSACSWMAGCPMAKTDDGAATALERFQNEEPDVEHVVKRLRSSDPHFAWTFGQWMTEKDGGSDVIGATRTNATRLAPDEECGDIHFETWLPKPTHKLNGLKWFSSAADAEVALTLALYEEAGVSEVDGRPRLSLFLVRVTPQLDAGRILVQKLKSKMGTRQLPTAELVLDDDSRRDLATSAIQKALGVGGTDAGSLDARELAMHLASVCADFACLSVASATSEKTNLCN